MARPTSKKRQPPPGQGALVPVQLRLEPDIIDAVNDRIEAMNAKRVLKLTRTDVVRLLLHGWVKGAYKIEGEAS